MYKFNVWSGFYLPLRKILIVFFLLISFLGYSQNGRYVDFNLPNSDNKRLTYGYSIGLFTSYYRIEFDEVFESSKFSEITAINPLNTFSFSIGPIGSIKLFQFLKLQSKLRFSFYNNSLEVIRNNGSVQILSIEATRIEFPFLLKYMSKRRGNIRVYMIGGINPSVRTGTRNNEEKFEDIIIVNPFNFALEYGFGFDIYFPLFKFSPEFRFSQGLVNILSDNHATHEITKGLKGMYMNSFSIYIQVGD